MGRIKVLCALAAAFWLFALGPQAIAGLGAPVKISNNTTGGDADHASVDADISNCTTNCDPSHGQTDGSRVVFASDATNLVPSGNNGHRQIYFWDNSASGAIQMISLNEIGQPSDGDNDPKFPTNSEEEGPPRITPDGQWVVWASEADDLVDGDNNHLSDIYLWNHDTGIVQRVSTSYLGGDTDDASYQPAISNDGRFVVFQSYATNLQHKAAPANQSNVYIWDRFDGTTERVSRNVTGGDANDASYYPAISGNGRFVAFSSNASNLTRHDDHNGADVFLWDKKNGSITRVTRGGADGDTTHTSFRPSVSSSGRWVTFDSDATNLVRNDQNGHRDIFVWDKKHGTIERISTNQTGGDSDGDSQSAEISGNGRWVVFQSAATNLVPSDTGSHIDGFLWDRSNGSITRIQTAVGTTSTSANGDSTAPRIERGSTSFASVGIVYQSVASNLVLTPADGNGASDVFFDF